MAFPVSLFTFATISLISIVIPLPSLSVISTASPGLHLRVSKVQELTCIFPAHLARKRTRFFLRGGNSDDGSREGEKKKPKTEQEVAAEKKQQELEAEAIDKFNEILWQGRDNFEEKDLISPQDRKSVV